MFAGRIGEGDVATPATTSSPLASSTSVMCAHTFRPTRSMTQVPPDGWFGSDRDDGTRGRHSQRVTVLARASTAVRRAHTVVEQAADSHATAEEAFRAAFESHAPRDGERDGREEREAREELEGLVRRLATRLRAEGAPPEIAVRRLKSAVEPAIFSSRDHDGADVEWRRAVASDVVRWFVEAYYAA